MYPLNNWHLHYLSITCDLTLSDMDQKIKMISHTVTANHAFYCWVSEGLPALSFIQITIFIIVHVQCTTLYHVTVMTALSCK